MHNSTSSGRKSALAAALTLVFLLGTSVGAQELSASAGIDKPFGTTEPKTGPIVQLKGLRGETVSLLLKFQGEGCHPVKLSRLELQRSGAHLSHGGGALAVQLSGLPAVTTTRPSYRGAPVGAQLDPVIPLRSSLLCAAPEGQWYLGEVTIPRQASPGNYSGYISLGDAVHVSGVHIEVNVGQMLLPEKPRLPIYAEASSFYLLKGHYGAWHEGEETLARQYTTEMARHRILTIKGALAGPPIIALNGKEQLDLDNAPTAAQSFNSVVLKDRPPWALIDLPTAFQAGVPPEKRERYYAAMEQAVRQRSWAQRSFLYFWDEPKESEYAALEAEAKLVRTVAPSLRLMVTTPWSPRFAPYVAIWCPVINQFAQPGFPPAARYAALQREGKSVWWYVSCMSHGCEDDTDAGFPDLVIDRPSAAVRTIGALSVANHLDAFLYYSVNNSYRNYPTTDPWNIPWDFSGNGDGTLFYPGRPGEHGFTTHEPVASLRLKLLREASYDADYIALMQALPERPPWFETELHALVPATTGWSRSYAAYQKLHDRIWTYLEGRTGGKK